MQLRVHLIRESFLAQMVSVSRWDRGSNQVPRSIPGAWRSADGLHGACEAPFFFFMALFWLHGVVSVGRVCARWPTLMTPATPTCRDGASSRRVPWRGI